MGLPDTLKGPRTRKILAVVAGILVLWAVGGFFLLPHFLRPMVERKLAAVLHRPVTLTRLSLNPFTLSAALEGLNVKEKDGKGAFFSFERLSANLEAISLFKGGPVIRAITLIRPSLALVRNEDGTYNVSDLLDEITKPKHPEEPEKPLRFSLNNIRVEGGSVDFDDRPKRTKHAVRGLTIGIPFLSNIPSKVEITTLPAFEATVNGAAVALHGRTKPFSPTRETMLDLDFTDVDLPYYLAYVPAATPSKLTSGRLDTKLKVAFTQPPKSAPALVVSGRAVLRKVAVELGGRPLAKCERFEAAANSVDVFGRRAQFTNLMAVEPEIWVRREKTGEYAIAAAFATPTGGSGRKPSATASPETGTRPPFLVEVSAIGIERGRMHYEDLSLAGPFQSVLNDVAVSVKGFTTAPGRKASLDVSAKSDTGETFRNTGTVSMAPLALEGEFAATGLKLERYEPFYGERVKFDVRDGVLDLKTKYRFTTGKDANTTLSSLSAQLASPRLTRRGEKQPFFKAQSIALAETSLDLAERDAAVGEITSAGGVLAVARDKEGNADITNLLAEPPPGARPQAPSAPWKVVVGRLALDGYTVNVDDRAPDRPARYALTKVNLELQKLSTEHGAKAALAARFGVNGRGIASAKGPVGLSPIFADLKVAVKGINLVPLQAYVLPSVKLSLARGALTGAGRLSFGEGANGKAKLVYTGNALVAGLLAVEDATKLDFFKWETFSLEGMRAGFNPVFLEASRLDITGLGCDLTIEADGTTNLSKVVGKPAPPDEDEGETETASAAAVSPAPPAVPPPSAPPPSPAPVTAEVTPIRIDTLTLKGGRIGLADHFIQPNYAATLTELTGRMTGLSSKAGTVAQLDLKGSLANHSPLTVTGSVNPLAATAFADVKASFRDIDLPPFTPYSGKYAGYGIARGALTMEVSYKLQNRKLSAQNRFLVDQFEFGDRIESPTATKLPVKLAIALLKDRNGVIDVDLPIEGSLDDPKFRIGKIIWKLIGNLIVKAATAPFALLGHLFGGGGDAELSSVDFVAGSAVLDEVAKKKLDALAKALENRPALKLEATGRFSGDEDSEGVKRLRFERKLKAQKLSDLAKKGEAPASVDDVVVDEKEYAAYLAKAYKREKFDKPRNVLGIAKSLPTEEMERLMLANAVVTGDDLTQLAFARANAVKDYLTGPGKAEAARIFVLEPGRTPAERKDGARGSRVDFSLR